MSTRVVQMNYRNHIQDLHDNDSNSELIESEAEE